MNDMLWTAADKIEARALGAARIIRYPGQKPLCSADDHDDRWCTDCARMEDGMEYAAAMLREMAVEYG